MNRSIFPLHILSLILFCYSLPMHAGQELSIDRLFSEKEIEKTVAGKIITSAYLKGSEAISTEPIIHPVKIAKTRYTSDTDYSDYEMLAIEKAFFPYPSDKVKMLELYNNLMKFSRLSETEYYSRSENKILPFILESSRIDSVVDGNSVEDPVYDNIIPKRIHYFQVMDNRFGLLRFSSEIYHSGNNFFIKNRSELPMTKYLFDINNKGEYQLISFFIYDETLKGYFYYAFNAMRIRSDTLLGLGMLTAENFSNRIRATTVHTAHSFGIDWEGMISPFK